MFSKIKVGDKVYLSVRVSSTNKDGIDSYTVVKVGRKYFYVDISSFRPIRYSKKDGQHSDTHYSTNELYLSPQTIKDRREKGRLNRELWKVFHNTTRPDLTLDQIRRQLKY